MRERTPGPDDAADLAALAAARAEDDYVPWDGVKRQLDAGVVIKRARRRLEETGRRLTTDQIIDARDSDRR